MGGKGVEKLHLCCKTNVLKVIHPVCSNFGGSYRYVFFIRMKRLFAFLVAALILLGSCGPKPMYKTREGKKKLKHYNALQFNDRRGR